MNYSKRFPFLKNLATFEKTGHTYPLGAVIGYYYNLTRLVFSNILNDSKKVEDLLDYISTRISDNFKKIKSEEELRLFFIAKLKEWCMKNLEEEIHFTLLKVHIKDLIGAIKLLSNAIDNSTLFVQLFYAGTKLGDRPSEVEIADLYNYVQHNKLAHLLFVFFTKCIYKPTFKNNNAKHEPKDDHSTPAWWETI